jgi:protein-tyrosine phosphatase
VIIDLHTHLLHGVDDGPRTLDESIDLARALRADGVLAAAATSHVSEAYPCTASLLDERLVELRAALDWAGVALDLVPGAEIDADCAARLDDEALRSFALGGSPWILIETPYEVYPFGLAELVAELGRRGHRCVLAHPERNRHVQDGDIPLWEIVQAGGLAQVTCASLRGALGRRSAEAGWRLLERGLAHLVATDAHDTQARRPRMSSARADLERRMGAAAVETLTERVPAALLGGASQEEAVALTREAVAGPTTRRSRRRG